jgi:hypothetical protein
MRKIGQIKASKISDFFYHWYQDPDKGFIFPIGFFNGKEGAIVVGWYKSNIEDWPSPGDSWSTMIMDETPGKIDIYEEDEIEMRSMIKDVFFSISTYSFK